MANLAALLGTVVAHKLRNQLDTLSDEDFKDFGEHVDPKEVARALMMMGPPFSGSELGLINAQCEEPFEHDFKYSDKWKDDVLDKYADHIQNYYYNYKPEAQAIDPSIDPEEEHIGPMAQDIEQVNPAAVQETPEGVKTVDTARLALMNAGAIADLAREVKELKSQMAPKGETLSAVTCKDIKAAASAPKPSGPKPYNHQQSNSMLINLLNKRGAFNINCERGR